MGGATPDTTAAVLAALAAAAVAAGTVALVWVNFLPTGHRPMVDAVSDYGASPSRLFYRVTVISLGGGALLLPAALAPRTGAPEGGLIWGRARGVTRLARAISPH